MADLVLSHTVPYEIWMMHETADELARTSRPNGDPIKNALLESFAIHARALIDFLEGKGTRPDDTGASEYTSPTYQPFAAGPVPTQLVTKINKQIAHITKSRTLDQKEKLNGTDIAALCSLLDVEMTEFKNSLLQIHQPTWDKRNCSGV